MKSPSFGVQDIFKPKQTNIFDYYKSGVVGFVRFVNAHPLCRTTIICFMNLIQFVKDVIGPPPDAMLQLQPRQNFPAGI